MLSSGWLCTGKTSEEKPRGTADAWLLTVIFAVRTVFATVSVTWLLAATVWLGNRFGGVEVNISSEVCVLFRDGVTGSTT